MKQPGPSGSDSSSGAAIVTTREVGDERPAPAFDSRFEICPATCREQSSWPTPLKPYVQTLGADVVWKEGLRTLGYPATWAQSGKEFGPVIDALELTATATSER